MASKKSKSSRSRLPSFSIRTGRRNGRRERPIFNHLLEDFFCFKGEEDDPAPEVRNMNNFPPILNTKFFGIKFEQVEQRVVAPDIPIFQFLIVLQDIEPKIWRRIKVPSDYTFYHLHLAIREVFGWNASHLHVFKVRDLTTGRKVNIGQPEPPSGYNAAEAWFGPDCKTVIDEQKVDILDYFKERKNQGIYKYDFGDRWTHKIWLEGVLAPIEGETYPKCIGGKRARPPEDAGGAPGYAELLHILANPNHPEYKDRKKWLEFKGEPDFNPEVFDISKVYY